MDRSATAAWSSGYVSDVVYTLGFHRELAPSYLDYVCLISGVENAAASRRRRYCELGCGRGFGIILLAASNPDIDFVGIDFNPSHIAEARSFAERSGLANVAFHEMDFGEAARSGDPQLGAFDIVALHGVYSWVTAPVRAAIHEFLRAKLVSGGIAYVSYNALPGWARVIPTQKLLFEAASRATGDSLARSAKGLQLLELLVEKSDSTMAKHGALSRNYLAHLAGRDKHYIAHEFLSEGWRPYFVTDAIAELSIAKLSYAGSANVAENRVELCVPKDLRETLRAAPDIGMRELLKDFVLGQQFRRDVFVKGPRALPQLQQNRLLKELEFASMPHVARLPDKLRVPAGEFTPRRSLLDALWQCVVERPATGAQLLDAAAKAGEEKEERVWLVVEILVHNGLIHPARSSSGGSDRAPGRRLNEAVMSISASADTHRYLAAPAIGSAISATYPERIIASLLAQEPALDDVAVANKTFDWVERSGQKLVREGRPLQRNDETVRSFARFVREFRDQRLPRWRMLGVVA